MEGEEGDQGVARTGRLEMGQQKVYPPPLLSHAEVCTNSIAFYDTLRRVHSALGTRFMIPVIGGKELDLHQLYVQVTQRGGIEKVISEKRWRDVIATFSFPPTTTSASFVLRKYYLSLLYHYEQVYFLRTEGPLIPPSATLQTKTHPCKLEQSSDPSDPSVRKKRAYPPRPSKVVPGPSHIIIGHEQVSSNDAPHLPAPADNAPAATDVNAVAGSFVAAAPTLDSIKTVVPATAMYGNELKAPAITGSKTANDVKSIACSYSTVSAPTSGESTPSDADVREATKSRTLSLSPTLRESTPSGDNLRVSGTIDGKFEHGYFVSAKFGTQNLHGILYHVSPLAEAHSTQNRASNPPPPVPTPASVLAPGNAITPYIPQTRSVHRRRKHKHRAPDHPKPNRSAYNFFFAEKHRELKAEFPHQEREYSKMIGAAWNQLSEEERSVYGDYGKRDKDRYIREMQEYRERRLVQPRGFLKFNGVVRGTEVAREVPNSKEVEKAEAASQAKE